MLHRPQIVTAYLASVRSCLHQGGSTPIVYHDDTEMQNGGNGGEGSGQIVPQVVQPDQVEEVGTLVPQATLEVIPGHLTPPR